MRKLFILTILVAFFACKKEGANTPDSVIAPVDTTKGVQTFPLLPGSYWIYDITEFDATTGVQTASRSATVELKDSAKYGQHVYYRVRPFLLRNIDSVSIGYYDSTAAKEVIIKSNGTTNNKLVSTLLYRPNTACKSGVRIYSNKDRIDINGYNCYKVNYETINCDGSVENIGDIYLREGIGLVHSDTYRVNGTTKVIIARQNLASYRIVK